MTVNLEEVLFMHQALLEAFSMYWFIQSSWEPCEGGFTVIPILYLSWFKAQYSENKDHGIQSHHFMANRWGNSGNSGNSGRLFFEAPKSLQMVNAAMKLKDTYSLEGKLWPT